MSENRIQIPIIPYGLRPEETIVQIATALRNIDSVTTDVFQQIENNIDRFRNHLSGLKKRSEVVAAKVDQLAGRNVATTVYSHNKFPTKNDDFDTMFRMDLNDLLDSEKVPISDKHQNAKYNKSSNTLKFYHMKNNIETFPKYEESILEQGLGMIPGDVEDVSSLLLFNTSEEIYNKYVMRDPLSVDVVSSPVIEENNPSKSIAAAPNSILNNYVFQNTEYFDSFYTPAYQEVPTIDVPLDLPDLPGIADNLKFNLALETSIAPSKQKTDTVGPVSTNEQVKAPVDNLDSRDVTTPVPKVETVPAQKAPSIEQSSSSSHV